MHIFTFVIFAPDQSKGVYGTLLPRYDIRPHLLENIISDWIMQPFYIECIFLWSCIYLEMGMQIFVKTVCVTHNNTCRSIIAPTYNLNIAVYINIQHTGNYVNMQHSHVDMQHEVTY